MSEVNTVNAKQNFDTLCRMLDNLGFKYHKDEKDLSLETGIQGDDFLIKLHIYVNPEKELISLISIMPFAVEEAKRIDLALAVCAANYGMADGSFDYDLSDGTILFRLTSSYKETMLSGELFKYMILVSMHTIDKYNDKFFMISKGMIEIQDFIESEKQS